LKDKNTELLSNLNSVQKAQWLSVV
jgi:hypothetical protein